MVRKILFFKIVYIYLHSVIKEMVIFHERVGGPTSVSVGGGVITWDHGLMGEGGDGGHDITSHWVSNSTVFAPNFLKVWREPPNPST